MSVRSGGYTSDEGALTDAYDPGDDQSSDNEGSLGEQQHGEDAEEYEEDEENAWKENYPDLQSQLEHVLTLLHDAFPPDPDEKSLMSRSSIEDVEDHIKDYMLDALLCPSKAQEYARTPTALHIMAKDYITNSARFSERVVNGVLRYLLKKFDAFKRKDSTVQSHWEPILTVAMWKEDSTDIRFLTYLKEGISPEDFRSLIDEKGPQNRNCLHHLFAIGAEEQAKPEVNQAVKRELEQAQLQRAQLLIPLARPEALTAKDDDHNTPLHLALHYAQLRRASNAYHDVVRLMILRGDKEGMANAFNKSKRSPIAFFKHTKTTYLEDLQKTKKGDGDSKNGAARKIKTKPGKRLPGEESGNLGSKNASEVPPGGKNTATATKTTAMPQKNLASGVPQSPIVGSKGPFDPTAKMDKERDPKGHKSGKAQVGPSPLAHLEDPNPSKGISRALTGDPAGPPRPMDRSSRSSARGQSRTAGPDTTSRPTAAAPPPSIILETAEPTHSSTKKEQTAPKVSSQSRTEKKSKTLLRNQTGEAGPAANDLIEFLENHYIRTQPELKARDLIYGRVKTPDINLSFNGHISLSLNGPRLTDAAAIRTLINRMKGPKGKGFSQVLAKVRLPVVARRKREETKEKRVKHVYVANQKAARTSGRTHAGENPCPGRDELFDVFEELAKARVKTIMELDVDDMDQPYHSDTAIEEALLGGKLSVPRQFNIEIWNWKKPDLSIDVILATAPFVREVHLYWTGNRSVLRGWGCQAGLVKLKDLKEVTVYAAPGVEKHDRMMSYLNDFQNDVIMSAQATTKADITITIVPKMKGLWENPGGDKNASADDPSDLPEQQHVWIEHMDSFQQKLVPLHQLLEDMQVPTPKLVKVALIDDGMDLGSYRAYNSVPLIAHGISCTSVEHDDPSPWYQSSLGHGNIMASMIFRLNPWTHLYVMKLCDSTSSDGKGLKIHAGSAAQAIKAAVYRGVDIISMSWSLQHAVDQAHLSTAQGVASGQDAEIRELDAAILEAKSKNIIMFCSAMDKVDADARRFYPWASAPESIMRIGAADATGKAATNVENGKAINYYFPGLQVLMDHDLRIKPHKDNSVTGSSVATALAAGLASLIRYCAILVQTFYEKPDHDVSGSRKSLIEKNPGDRDDSRLPPISAEVLEGARNMAKDKPLRDRAALKVMANKLKLHKNMDAAFNSIQNSTKAREQFQGDKRYLPVWSTFGDLVEEIEKNKDDHAKTFELLEVLIGDLCKDFKPNSTEIAAVAEKEKK